MKNDRFHTWVSQLFDFRLANNHFGLTLFELLISITILGIIMIGLHQVLGTALSSYDSITDKQNLLARARHAMERMVMFVEETDYISSHMVGEFNKTTLTVSERVLDTYKNDTHAYMVEGDGIPDADNDSDGFVNEDGASGSDPREYVEFTLSSGILSTRGPDYSTADTNDSTAYKTLCENVTVFESDRLANNLMEIRLTLNDGKSTVSLKTRVFARNINSCGGADDTTPPNPDPMTWSTPPIASGPSAITMTATTAVDWSCIEYYFECTAGGGHDSGWQDSSTYTDTGLVPSTMYTYRVKARDKSPNYNETAFSSEAFTTTDAGNDIYVYDITMSLRAGGGPGDYGQATVWIRDDIGADVQGATVYGDWSGCASESGNGVTGSDGKVMLETGSRKKGCTWIFAVTDVVKSGYPYNPALNVETSDSIPVP